jgi:N,N-dimethylformamidase
MKIKTQGVSIPRLGFGTFRMPGAESQPVVESAIAPGFRHIDTATMYENETAVGAALAGEIIGDKGLAHGGAAGIEIDRYDLSLGTPPHAKIVASSGGHPDNYMLVCEEVLYAHPGMTGTYDYRIRADMVYFTTPKNGAVFSTGAIAFGQALPCDNFANNASKVLKNVVDAFSKAVNLPGSAWVSEEKQWR